MPEPWKEITQTITSDNGKEFAVHQQIAEPLDVKFFLAHPYAAWERGSNENTNCLLCQYFPKKYKIEAVTDNHPHFALDRINHRHRKLFAFKTYLEVLLGQSVALET